jgi:muramoyltetrapeptide carboxypeptidase
VLLPHPVRPGDTVAAFAGSSPFDAALVLRGLGWLSERYRVRFDREMFARTGYLAGSDERRAAELRRALVDPEVKAVIAARGGYGLLRIVHLVDWDAFARAPKWIVGFSDVTALHVEAAARGIASLHGPNVAGVGRGDPWTRERFEAVLADPERRDSFEGLSTWAPGTAEGPLFGGNLTLLHACAAAGRLRVPDGAILLIEDVTERPYRIDRMLTTLRLGGHLDRVAGVMVGEWTDCAPGADGVTAEDVVRERLGSLGIPIVAGAPVGHGRFNAPVVLGSRWKIVSDGAAWAERSA